MDPIKDPKTKKFLNDLARAIDDALNPDLLADKKEWGFAVMMFRFTDVGKGVENRMNWISNAKRADMIVALKEMVAQLEGRVQDAPDSTN